MCGSSPLARGLQTELPRRVAIRRIIPARAGFTHWSSPPRSASKDHPRSRGVYRGESGRAARDWGSSPLARGLHVYLSGLMRYHRIIPARAGFTTSGPTPVSSGPDHPRSRGVYRNPLVEPVLRGGSSPLARGLPPQPNPTQLRDRIIPARAGFTSFSYPFLYGPKDHPRSRGVYTSPAPQTTCCTGSSPLARGLLSVASGVPETVLDHPRSRGVYIVIVFYRHSFLGSSPLARGLHGQAGVVVVGQGIIPARAGFTPPHPAHGAGQQDHPRSRGVYLAGRCGRRCRGGSSPLARGLLVCGGVSSRVRGIIPARAGFTGKEEADAPRRTDHPRSRGVY